MRVSPVGGGPHKSQPIVIHAFGGIGVIFTGVCGGAGPVTWHPWHWHCTHHDPTRERLWRFVGWEICHCFGGSFVAADAAVLDVAVFVVLYDEDDIVGVDYCLRCCCLIEVAVVLAEIGIWVGARFERTTTLSRWRSWESIGGRGGRGARPSSISPARLFHPLQIRIL